MSAIAFIGLGQMGAPMAKNLLKQGHQLNVFDVNPQAVQALVESGARAAATPAQAATDAEFVITMLPNGDPGAQRSFRRARRVRRVIPRRAGH